MQNIRPANDRHRYASLCSAEKVATGRSGDCVGNRVGKEQWEPQTVAHRVVLGSKDPPCRLAFLSLAIPIAEPCPWPCRGCMQVCLGFWAVRPFGYLSGLGLSLTPRRHHGSLILCVCEFCR